jgi:hypothetical protein
VGCGVNFETKEVFFTRDGHFLGIAYVYDKIPDRAKEDFASSGWFPVVALMANPADIDFNFGQRLFVFDLNHEIMWSTFGKGVTATLGHLKPEGGPFDPIPYHPDRLLPNPTTKTRSRRRGSISDISDSGSGPESEEHPIYSAESFNSDEELGSEAGSEPDLY